MVQYLSLLLRKRLYGALAMPAAVTAGVVLSLRQVTAIRRLGDL